MFYILDTWTENGNLLTDNTGKVLKFETIEQAEAYADKNAQFFKILKEL